MGERRRGAAKGKGEAASEEVDEWDELSGESARVCLAGRDD